MALQAPGHLADRGRCPAGEGQGVREDFPLRVPGARCPLVLPYHRSLQRPREVVNPARAGGGAHAENRVSLVRQRRGSATPGTCGLRDLPDLRLGHQDDVARDLTERAREERERAPDLRDAGSVCVPRRRWLCEIELPGELLEDLGAGVAERGERAGSSPQLSCESPLTHFEQPTPRLQDRDEPAGGLEAEGRWQCLLEQGPPRDRGAAVGQCEPGQRSGDDVCLYEDQAQRTLREEHRGGVYYVLARSTLVDVPGGLFRYLGDRLGKYPDERRDRAALCTPLSYELLRGEQARLATLFAAGGDGLSCIGWDQACPRLRGRQGALSFQHRP